MSGTPSGTLNCLKQEVHQSSSWFPSWWSSFPLSSSAGGRVWWSTSREHLKWSRGTQSSLSSSSLPPIVPSCPPPSSSSSWSWWARPKGWSTWAVSRLGDREPGTRTITKRSGPRLSPHWSSLLFYRDKPDTKSTVNAKNDPMLALFTVHTPQWLIFPGSMSSYFFVTNKIFRTRRHNINVDKPFQKGQRPHPGIGFLNLVNNFYIYKRISASTSAMLSITKT